MTSSGMNAITVLVGFLFIGSVQLARFFMDFFFFNNVSLQFLPCVFRLPERAVFA